MLMNTSISRCPSCVTALPRKYSNIITINLQTRVVTHRKYSYLVTGTRLKVKEGVV